MIIMIKKKIPFNIFQPIYQIYLEYVNYVSNVLLFYKSSDASGLSISRLS